MKPSTPKQDAASIFRIVASPNLPQTESLVAPSEENSDDSLQQLDDLHDSYGSKNNKEELVENQDRNNELVAAIYLSSDNSDDSLAAERLSGPQRRASAPQRASSLGTKAQGLINKLNSKQLSKESAAMTSSSSDGDNDDDDRDSIVGAARGKWAAGNASLASVGSAAAQLQVSHVATRLSVSDLFEGAERERRLDDELRARRLQAMLGRCKDYYPLRKSKSTLVESRQPLLQVSPAQRDNAAIDGNDDYGFVADNQRQAYKHRYLSQSSDQLPLQAALANPTHRLGERLNARLRLRRAPTKGDSDKKQARAEHPNVARSRKRHRTASLSAAASHFSLYALKYPRDQLNYALETFRRWYRNSLRYHTLAKRMEFDEGQFCKWYATRGRPLNLLSLDHFDRVVVWIRDERDAIQQRTFTKWVNKYLRKRNQHIDDLFQDLRSGQHLVSLLELLSGQSLPRERGKMRVHKLQNIQIALNFMRLRKVRLVNIRPEEIVDGNQKLTLGLIWTIILHFQLETDNFKEILIKWAQRTTQGYPGCKVVDLTSSWRDGLAFNAIIHRNRPDLLEYRTCRKETPRENLEQAFSVAERELSVTRLLDPEDVDVPYPDEKSMITYLAQLYEMFPDPTDCNPLLDGEKIRRIDEYKELASRLLSWIKDSTLKLESRKYTGNILELRSFQQLNERFIAEEIPPKEHDKQRLASISGDILKMAQDLNMKIANDLHTDNIQHHWQRLLDVLQERNLALKENIRNQESLKNHSDQLMRDIKLARYKLNTIEHNINNEDILLTESKKGSSQISQNRVLELDDALIEVSHILDNIKKSADEYFSQAKRAKEDSMVVRSDVGDLLDHYKRVRSKWDDLHTKLEKTRAKLNALNEAMNKFKSDVGIINEKLKDIEQRLNYIPSIGKDIETLSKQTKEMKDFSARINEAKLDLNVLIPAGERLISQSLVPNPAVIRELLKNSQDHVGHLEKKIQERLTCIEIALKKVEFQKNAENEFKSNLEQLEKRSNELERKFAVMAPVANDLSALQKQLASMEDFERVSSNVRDQLASVVNLGEDLIADGLIVDPKLVRDSIHGPKKQMDSLEKKAANRLRDIEHALNRLEKIKATTDKFSNKLDGVRKDLDELEHCLDSMNLVGRDHDSLQVQVGEMQEFIKRLEKVKNSLNNLTDLGEDCIRKGMSTDPRAMREGIKDCQAQLARLEERAQKRLGSIEHALLNRESLDKTEAKFTKALEEVSDWLDSAKGVLVAEENVHGDIDTVTALIEQHKAFEDELAYRQPALDEIRRMEADLFESSPASYIEAIKQETALVTNKWKELERLCREKSDKLKEAHSLADSFHKSIHSLLESLADAEMKFRFQGTISDDEAACRQELAEHEKLLRKLELQAEQKDKLSNMARSILSRCHPDADPVLKHWINILQSRWDEIDAWAKQRGDRLNDHLQSLVDILGLVEELINYLTKHEARLSSEETKTLPEDSDLEALLAQHQIFIDDLRRREPDVDRVVKIFSSKTNNSTSRTILHSLTTKTRPDSRASSGRFSAGSRSTTPTSRTSYATYRDEYPEVKQARAKIMLNKWRSVWQLSLDKMQRLKDHLEHLEEVERMIHFDFDEWRRRFLTWMAGKKARVTDFYRSIDKDNDGRISTADFAEGVLRSKFTTSRPEMERVAGIFDKNRDGTIDHKEYLDTLRPDKPVTEDEVIQDEVQRQVSMCNCMQRYKVYHVGDGKYRFGESQKLRLVRILRSKVMVRVGGGWEALEEFLQKNDPCRAKGRTNVELREQFILPEGASQAMAAFKSKMSNIPSGQAPPLGPVTKIREKTDRSMPMSGSGSAGGSASGSRFGSPT